MSPSRFPHPEPRRRKELLRELVERARVWLPEWQPRAGSKDFAQALFEIAARLGSEVTQRLDRVPEKSFRGFIHWLGVGGAAARPARVPVVFGMTPGSEPVLADALVQLQALDIDPPVTLETEQPLRIFPGRLTMLVAADPAADRFNVAPPGPLQMTAAAPPNEWIVTAIGDQGRVQLAQVEGIEAGLMVVDGAGEQHEVMQIDKGIARLRQPLAPGTARVSRVLAFDAFDQREIDRQQHALYIGADQALDLSTPAVIEVSAQGAIAAEADWAYWGKSDDEDAEAGWQSLADPVRRDGRLLLVKPAGKIEPTDVAGRTRRWLRAKPRGEDKVTRVQASAITLRVNCRPDDGQWPDHWTDAETDRLGEALAQVPAQLKAEAIANTAPLVVDRPFYPLGREPRMFDAFYVGSRELLSKPKALVTLDFEIGDQFGGALAAVKLQAGHLVVAVGNDGRLQRLVVKDDAAAPEFEPGTQPVGDDGKPIPLQPGVEVGTGDEPLIGGRPGAVVFGLGIVYVTAIEAAPVNQQAIWLHVRPAPDPASEWRSLGVPPAEGRVTETLLVQAMGRTVLRAYAIAGERLYRRDALNAGEWAKVPIEHDGRPVSVVKVVQFDRLEPQAGGHDEDDGLLCVDKSGDAYRCKDGKWLRVSWDHQLDPAVYPLVAGTEEGFVCVSRLKSKQGVPASLIAARLDQLSDAQVVEAELIGGDFGFAAAAHAAGASPEAIVLYVAKLKGVNSPVRWQPFPSKNPPVVCDAPTAGKAMTGAPLALGSLQLVPAENGTVYIGRFDTGLWQAVEKAAVSDALVFSHDLGNVPPDELLVDITPKNDVLSTVLPVQSVLDSQQGRGLVLKQRLTDPVGKVGVYRWLHHDVRSGTRLDARRFRLAAGDTDVKKGCWLRIDQADTTRLYRVEDVEQARTKAPVVARVHRDMPQSLGTVRYQAMSLLVETQCKSIPALDVQSLRPPLREKLSAGSRIYFPKLEPSALTLRDKPGKGAWIVLPERRLPLADPKLATTAFLVDANSTLWLPFGPARPRNPDLSWEYWNGSGWWQIRGLKDETANLVSSGKVDFCVPDDLKPTDVVGRANHWVRARLVGGDYGQQTVTSETTQVEAARGKPGSTVVKSVVSLEGIRAPFVVSMKLSFQVCCPVIPDVVLAEDGAAVVDLSGANRTPGAVVPHFIRLSESLADLGPAGTDDHGGKALYLAFDAPLQGGPIGLLFLVGERDHGAAYPLRLEALRRSGFEPVVAEDNTRGLNESGTLVFALDKPPMLASLFGSSGHWLRVRPNSRFTGEWQPLIRGAWLNATWAAAAETHVLELLGSSDGSPHQRVVLAKPPVIGGSLELRVRERLGEEDKERLRRRDPQAVEDELGHRIGPWVRWRLIGDTDDAGPDERVYALDEAKGEIVFGDGLHGKIPPIGPDAILAQRYRHGGGAAANGVAAWSQVNLVTPLQGVDSVVVPDGAAGGSDPQDAATTLRFAPDNVFVRERVLTLRDLEVLAQQFSPDIAQVRAASMPQGVRLLVVARGRTPKPSEALIRELRSYLLQHAAPALAEEGALLIRGPDLVLLQMSLHLVIDRIEHSGAVAAEAKTRLARLLDAATGGLNRAGWPLGQLPGDDDIAAALAGTAHLDAVNAVTLRSVLPPDGAAGDPPAALLPTQLARLADDGMRFEFELADAQVAK